MAVRLNWGKHRLKFKAPAGTSRGFLTDHYIYILRLTNIGTGRTGWGETAPLPGLSPDDPGRIEDWLNHHSEFEGIPAIPDFLPALRFGLETAQRDLSQKDDMTLYPNDFTEGKRGIPINGLIWMSDILTMEKQFREKIAAGFTCLKMKIGAIDVDEELALLKRIREDYADKSLELRVDANGAFSIENVFPVLDHLAELNIHSIEQPLPAGDWEGLTEVCAKSPIPIALDESLIGITDLSDRIRLLETIKPKFIILKPTLLGGFSACESWIKLAEERSIGWWVTSALESNVGLNAIAQWTATLPIKRPQGLGTGSLYTNNFTSPLKIEKGALWMDNSQNWEMTQLQSVCGK